MNPDHIDFERLRDDLYENSLGAAFCGGFGGAFMESEEIKNASDDELLRMASNQGVRVGKYKE